jgi:hypothetical protein
LARAVQCAACTDQSTTLLYKAANTTATLPRGPAVRVGHPAFIQWRPNLIAGGHPGCEEERGPAHLLCHPVDLRHHVYVRLALVLLWCCFVGSILAACSFRPCSARQPSAMCILPTPLCRPPALFTLQHCGAQAVLAAAGVPVPDQCRRDGCQGGCHPGAAAGLCHAGPARYLPMMR